MIQPPSSSPHQERREKAGQLCSRRSSNSNSTFHQTTGVTRQAASRKAALLKCRMTSTTTLRWKPKSRVTHECCYQKTANHLISPGWNHNFKMNTKFKFNKHLTSSSRIRLTLVRSRLSHCRKRSIRASLRLKLSSWRASSRVCSRQIMARITILFKIIIIN